ncbi:hypothetical protein FACS189443_3370 [Planctomycetales bacterium]|nr:hypothetical protein FACS189443_3370 [Planctomycetales bacterium]
MPNHQQSRPMQEQQIPSFPPDIYNQIMEMFRVNEVQRQKEAAERAAERKEREAEWEAKMKKELDERDARWAAERKEAEAAREAAREAERQKDAAERKEAEKKLNKQIGFLSNRIGDIIQAMVEGNIVDKFQRMGYEFTQCANNVKFRNKKQEVIGEIDLLLEDGDVALLIEVKTTLEEADVKEHIVRLEKYGRYADAKGDKRRFVAAVAGAVVSQSVRNFAHQNGIYVIVQSGEAVRIIKPPKGFTPQEW